ncbi:MAG: hypothetical protein RML45_05845 [Acetobacteraceae bacterium]|nr:hypothetical protein [Acetobacteraceae bacterium]
MAPSSPRPSETVDGQSRKTRQGSRGSLGFWALGVATGVLLGVALPTGLLLSLGLIPSALAVLADSTPGRWTARTVLAFNLAGLAPALRTLWLEGHSLAALGGLVFRLDGLPLAYAAAAFGAAMPVVAAWAVLAVLEARAALRIAELERRRAALRETWGEAVDEPPAGPVQQRGPA